MKKYYKYSAFIVRAKMALRAIFARTPVLMVHIEKPDKPYIYTVMSNKYFNEQDINRISNLTDSIIESHIIYKEMQPFQRKLEEILNSNSISNGK